MMGPPPTGIKRLPRCPPSDARWCRACTPSRRGTSLPGGCRVCSAMHFTPHCLEEGEESEKEGKESEEGGRVGGQGDGEGEEEGEEGEEGGEGGEGANAIDLCSE